MASAFCERRLWTSTKISTISRTQNFLSQNGTKTWSTITRPRAGSDRRLPIASERRNLSTTTALQARLIQRPQRPYQFTQLIQLSDGSTFTVRTTSPHPLHRSSKDTRNHAIWQPSDKSLRNVEVDEAGRLAAFRNRFGRGWDLAADKADEETDATQSAASGNESTSIAASSDSLADLLSGYAAKEGPTKSGGLSAKEQARKDKKKK